MMSSRTTLLTVCMIVASAAALCPAQAFKPAEPAPDVTPVPATRVYDLRDLMMTIGDYPFGGQIGAPAEDAILAARGQQGTVATTQPSRGERMDQVIKLIEETVESDSWRDNGGTAGAIREISGLLVVTQTESAHRQIATLLGQLREDHLRTVRVQADWVMLTPEEARSLLPADQKSEGKVAARTIEPAALAKLAAPAFHAELSCFSGQTVSISAGRTRTAIVDQQAVVAQDAAALTPTVRQIQAGGMLQITPTLETTLDTAVVDVHTGVADWNDGGRVEVSQRQTQASTTTGVRVGGEAPASVDRLNVLSQEFRTTARLPVGKPVLIGGMSAEPSQTQPASSQLYLVLQLTAGK